MSVQQGAVLNTQGFGSRPENVEVPFITNRAPTASDVNFPLGKRWLDTANNIGYELMSQSSVGGVLQSTWAQTVTAAGALASLTGDAGGPLAPVLGNINILGAAGELTTSGAGNTITVGLEAAVTFPGSATTTTSMNVGTTLTSAGATTLATGGASVNTFGNAVGATSVTITSGTGGIALVSTGTGDITAFSTDTLLLDSAGVMELNSSAGVISIGNDAVSQNINIGTAGTRALVIGNSTATTSVALNAGTGSSVNIGTNAIAHTVTIGNIIGATAVAINTGTGGHTVTTTGAGDIVLNSADTVLIDSAGVLELNSSAGVISVGNDAVAQNINLGTAGARTIAIGSAASTQTILGTTNINAAGAAITTIGTGGTGAVNIGNATGNTLVTGSLTTTTTLTATLGAITATNGNLVFGTAGNKIISTSVGTLPAAGANSFGSVTLAGGTATVATTSVTANSLVVIWRQSIGATGAAGLGMLSVGTITAATSFVINALQPADATALQASDVSVIGWMIIN